jgi:hypothetical protein
MVGYLERLKTKKRPPQALQKLQKGESTPAHGTAKTAKSPFYSKCSKGGRHISEKPHEIPAPSPPGMGAEYHRLWNQAWRLADFIDDPEGTPIEGRRAKLPELYHLRAQMADIERQAVPASGPDPAPAGTWHTWESSTTTRDTSPDTCPARCRRTGKCYAGAYFKGKPGPAKDCEPDGCQHIIQNERADQ